MTSVQHKVKINNSYESEPSSGSGSSLSGNNDFIPFDNLQLGNFLKTPSLALENTSKEASQIICEQNSELKLNRESSMCRGQHIVSDLPLNSNEQPSFEDFSEGSFRKMGHQYVNNYCVEKKIGKENKEIVSPSTSKITFPKFYDIILEENSSNAVDLSLSKCNIVDTNMRTQGEEHSIPNTNKIKSVANVDELSFNGKFTNLVTKQDANEINTSECTDENIPVLQETDVDCLVLGDSFILKKFSNAKSPDLFDDDSENNDNDVDNNNEDSDIRKEGNDEVQEEIKQISEASYAAKYVQYHIEQFMADSIKNTSNLVQKDLAESSVAENSVKDLGNSSNQNYKDPVEMMKKVTCMDEFLQTRASATVSTSVEENLNKSSTSYRTESSFIEDQTQDNSFQLSNHNQNVAWKENLLFRENCRYEKELLRRIRKCLAGVPPPPSLTIPKMDVMTSVITQKEKVLNFLNTIECNTKSEIQRKSLFAPTHNIDEIKLMKWNDILAARHPGLCFNLNKASESKEYLALSVVERFVGSETASSYKNSPTSAKKRNLRIKLLTQSPGNRLSHLAKRRAIFSSAHLATTSQKSNIGYGPKIIMDNKKGKNRRKATPKRKTPGSKKKVRKTPSSSARKRVLHFDHIRLGPSRETSKRALFQSPAKNNMIHQINPMVNLKPEIAVRVEKSKRALFSPDVQSQESIASFSKVSSNTSIYNLETLLKRKRTHDDDESIESAMQNSKLFRGSADNLTPRSLKIKSQSFCIGSGTTNSNSITNHSADTILNTMNLTNSVMAPKTIEDSFLKYSSNSQTIHRSISNGSCSGNNNNLLFSKLQRAHSEMTPQSNALTENQKKKLLWAVSQALQEKKINTKHESFKQYASILARVVRRLFQEYYHKNATSNSETMLRLAKKYVFYVISGKSVDDIYINAKFQIDEKKLKSAYRLSGYIGADEYEQRKRIQLEKDQKKMKMSCFGGSFPNIFTSESSIDLYNVANNSQTSLIAPTSSTSSLAIDISMSQSSNYFGHIYEDDKLTQNINLHNSKSSTIKNYPDSTLKNSSSKSNLCGFALRENVDGEQRRSAQKNFTGRNQCNVSLYACRSPQLPNFGSDVKTIFNQINKDLGMDKAKRQIIFDN